MPGNAKRSGTTSPCATFNRCAGSGPEMLERLPQASPLPPAAALASPVLTLRAEGLNFLTGTLEASKGLMCIEWASKGRGLIFFPP